MYSYHIPSIDITMVVDTDLEVKVTEPERVHGNNRSLSLHYMRHSNSCNIPSPVADCSRLPIPELSINYAY